jgi:mono/diheme cytochrome c family protein
MLLALMGLLACAGCALRLCKSCADTRAPDVVATDREEFVRACASCHGVDGRGAGPVAAALRTPPADLTVLAERAGGRFPRARVIGVLTGDLAVTAHGSREMPVWSERFAPSDFAATAAAAIYARRWLETIASYLDSIQRPTAADMSSGPSH